MEILTFLGVFCAGYAFSVLLNWFIERRALSLVRQKANAKGQQDKQDQAERLMMFLTEVKQAYDRAKSEGKDIKAFATTDLPAVALRYPDVVLKFGSRLYKLLKGEGIDTGGIDLGGLLGGQT